MTQIHYCPRCGEVLTSEQVKCAPRCTSRTAYWRLIPFCVKHGRQNCQDCQLKQQKEAA